MIGQLDLWRSQILKWTMKLNFFRQLVLSRPRRILFLSLLALVLYLGVSLFYPLWLLLLGPILWGVPHLIASLRYNVKASFAMSQVKKVIILQTAIWLCVFAYRLAIDHFHQTLFWSEVPLLFEGCSLVFAFIAQAFLLKRFSLMMYFYFFLYSVLILMTFYQPVSTALFLLIGHNYVPLIAWYKSCQTKKDFQVFSLISVSYIGLSLILITGGFQFLYAYLTPQSSIAFLNWNFADITDPYGAQIADSAFWFRVVSLYAFSQSFHYFLWLKAIPENGQSQQFPPSFKSSFGRLSSDFGAGSLYVMVVLILAGLAYWLFFEFQVARVIYFAVASYHGFMEFSMLPFLKSKLRL